MCIPQCDESGSSHLHGEVAPVRIVTVVTVVDCKQQYELPINSNDGIKKSNRSLNKAKPSLGIPNLL